MSVAAVDQRGDVIECAGVDITRIGDDDGWSIELTQRGGERVQVEPGARGWEALHGVPAESQHVQGLDRAGMDFGAAQDRNGRVPGETVLGGVEPQSLAGPQAGRRPADEVGERGAPGDGGGPRGPPPE